MDILRDKTNEDFAEYLEMVACDYRDSGSESTAEDYEESARRIREFA